MKILHCNLKSQTQWCLTCPIKIWQMNFNDKSAPTLRHPREVSPAPTIHPLQITLHLFQLGLQLLYPGRVLLQLLCLVAAVLLQLVVLRWQTIIFLALVHLPKLNALQLVLGFFTLITRSSINDCLINILSTYYWSKRQNVLRLHKCLCNGNEFEKAAWENKWGNILQYIR